MKDITFSKQRGSFEIYEIKVLGEGTYRLSTMCRSCDFYPIETKQFPGDLISPIELVNSGLERRLHWIQLWREQRHSFHSCEREQFEQGLIALGEIPKKEKELYWCSYDINNPVIKFFDIQPGPPIRIGRWNSWFCSTYIVPIIGKSGEIRGYPIMQREGMDDGRGGAMRSWAMDREQINFDGSRWWGKGGMRTPEIAVEVYEAFLKRVTGRFTGTKTQFLDYLESKIMPVVAHVEEFEANRQDLQPVVWVNGEDVSPRADRNELPGMVTAPETTEESEAATRKKIDTRFSTLEVDDEEPRQTKPRDDEVKFDDRFRGLELD